MRVVARAVGVVTLIIAAMTYAAPASADEAPWCDTGGSRFICTTGTPAVSWTIYRQWGQSTVTVPGTSSYVIDTCRGNTLVRVNYNYYAGGVLTASPASQFLCNPGDWP